jgi:hypothetical protein
VHLQVENTRRCCGAVARGEADLALVGGVMPPDLEHLLQVRRRALILPRPQPHGASMRPPAAATRPRACGPTGTAPCCLGRGQSGHPWSRPPGHWDQGGTASDRRPERAAPSELHTCAL